MEVLIMIKMYKPNDTSFKHNKYVMSDILKCEIEEKLNGVFSISVEYPLYDRKGIGQLISRGWVISAPVPDERDDQLFVISEVDKDSKQSKVTAYGRCIGQARLGTNFVRDTNVVGKTRGLALAQILENTLDPHGMSVRYDNDSKQANLRIVRYSPLHAMLGSDDNTMINRFGGDYVFDNFAIFAVNEYSRSKVFEIAYGKNLEGIQESLNDADLVTRIIPQGGNELLLPEYYIDSPNIGKYERVYNKHITFQDIAVKEEDESGPAVTEEQAIAKLRDVARRMFSEQKIDQIHFNYKVNFVTLAKTEYYGEYVILESVCLGDKVRIRHSKMGLTLTGRVISYRYDCIAKKYVEIELGVKKRTVSDAINDVQKDVNLTKQKIEMEVTNLDDKLSAKIEVTEKGIRETITDVEDGLKTEITKTAEGITETMTKADGELSTEIKKVAGEVSSKVSAGDVKTIITQSPDQVKVAFNNGSNYIELLPEGLKTTHGDGSYAMMGKGGMKWHKGSTSSDYHYLTYVLGFTTTSDPNTLVTIQLPEEFKGKDFGAYATLSDTWGDSGNYGEPWVIQRMVAFVKDKDISAGTVRIQGYRCDKNYNTGEYRYKAIAGMLIVIA